MANIFKKHVVFQISVGELIVASIVLTGGIWAGIHFLYQDTSALTSEIADLKSAKTTLQSKNEQLLREQRERPPVISPDVIAKLKSERDIANTERDQLTESVRKLRFDRDTTQTTFSDLQQANRKLKDELSAAIRERDQLRSSPPKPGATPATSAAITPGPIPWKGPRCSEETRGQACPPDAPTYGHEAPCLPNEQPFEVSNMIDHQRNAYYNRNWCKAK